MQHTLSVFPLAHYARIYYEVLFCMCLTVHQNLFSEVVCYYGLMWWFGHSDNTLY